MKFIEPLGIESIAARRMRTEYANVVQIAFGNDPCLPPQVRGLFVKPVAKLGQYVARAEIENPVDRVQPKRIDVILSEPIERVVDDEAANPVAEWAVEIHSAPQGVRYWSVK